MVTHGVRSIVQRYKTGYNWKATNIIKNHFHRWKTVNAWQILSWETNLENIALLLNNRPKWVKTKNNGCSFKFIGTPCRILRLYKNYCESVVIKKNHSFYLVRGYLAVNRLPFLKSRKIGPLCHKQRKCCKAGFINWQYGLERKEYASF